MSVVFNYTRAITLLKSGKTRQEVAKIMGYNFVNSFNKAFAAYNKKNEPLKKTNTIDLPPQTISLYRNQWAEEIAKQDSSAKKAWVTRKYKLKSGIDFAKEAKCLSKQANKEKKTTAKIMTEKQLSFKIMVYKPITQQVRDLTEENAKLKRKIERIEK